MNLPEISENLIEQLNHGNTKAFDKIYHTYYLYLCAIAVYYVHDKRVAGEIVNDVFVAFWQNRHHITHPALPEHSEMNTIIMKKVEELPAKCRAIFKASLYEGKTYSEIAEEQNINVTTVRVQMKIALTKLRESLGTPYMIAILMFL